MPFVTVGDIEIYHEVRGTGPRVLFIGGTGGDLRKSPNVFDGPLSRHATVLAYDQRGLGQTSKPDAPATMADYAADAAGLLDALDWESAHVVGVSYGGMVAQELAIRRPDLVERLVLCCTSSGGEGKPSYPLHELRDLDPETRRRTQLAISDTRRDLAWQEANPEAATAILDQMASDEVPPDEDPDREMGARRQLEARQGHDTWDRLDRIASPTLVAAGRYDGIAPVANSEALVSRIPDAELQLFDGGHLFLVQDRGAWPAILEFLEVG
ncbi:MAG: alpha/beta fold hydrolase [Acidimicrobiales bacterium]